MRDGADVGQGAHLPPPPNPPPTTRVSRGMQWPHRRVDNGRVSEPDPPDHGAPRREIQGLQPDGRAGRALDGMEEVSRDAGGALLHHHAQHPLRTEDRLTIEDGGADVGLLDAPGIGRRAGRHAEAPCLTVGENDDRLLALRRAERDAPARGIENQFAARPPRWQQPTFSSVNSSSSAVEHRSPDLGGVPACARPSPQASFQ